MARNHNKLSFIGHLGRDPEMRYTPTGKAVTTFSVGVNAGGEQPVTIWYRCSAWEKQAEVCNQFLKKGSKVFVEGVLVPDEKTGGPRIWTDQEDNPRASFEVNVREIEFLSPKSGNVPEVPVDEDIPF